MSNISHTAGSSNIADPLSKKCSYVFDQVNLNVKMVRSDKIPAILSENTVSSKPTFSGSDSHLDALEALKKSGAIQVIYPKQSLGNLVKSTASAVTSIDIKNTRFLD